MLHKDEIKVNKDLESILTLITEIKWTYFNTKLYKQIRFDINEKICLVKTQVSTILNEIKQDTEQLLIIEQEYYNNKIDELYRSLVEHVNDDNASYNHTVCLNVENFIKYEILKHNKKIENYYAIITLLPTDFIDDLKYLSLLSFKKSWNEILNHLIFVENKIKQTRKIALTNI